MTSFDLQAALDDRRRAHLYRRRRVVEAVDGPRLTVDGRELLNFCSNDYLALAQHPEVLAAFKYGADTYGVGAGAAHLINGHTHAHHALEEELADFTGRPRALIFSTGYMANIGTVAALVGKGDAVFEDRLNHASLIDAGLYSQARWRRYAHGDVVVLDKQLAAADSKRKLVLTDGVFSMDGDIAPLPQLAETCARHDAWLMVDDAHGFGVLGKHGAGSLSHFGLNTEQVPVLMGTLGKAAGVFGAFVAGSEELIETLIQDARTYVYTTALPPAVAEALRASLRVMRFDHDRRERLQACLYQFKQGAAQLGLNMMPSDTPIQPVLIGEAEQAVAVSEALMQKGIWVTAIRPPTVPAGTARLRITLSAMHSEQQVNRLLDALAEVLK